MDSDSVGGVDRELLMARRVLAFWGLVQVPRVAGFVWSGGEMGSLHPLILTALVMIDKLSGNLFEDAAGSIYARWLGAAATKDTHHSPPGHGFPAALGLLVAATPIACQSFSEVAEVVTKAFVERLLDADSTSSSLLDVMGVWVTAHVPLLVAALVLYALFANAFMVNGIIAKKKDTKKNK
mmetsp:Transcript_57159/g.134537  ORF Transcript_57159/g.134537 Transcript_57159/m.134537 type:complete len:181 (+) Transcript_57159:1-543(+)